MHDIADFEGRGLIGVFLVSSEFADAVHVQSAALGFPAAHILVPHPIQDRTDQEMRGLAEAAYVELLASLTAQ